MGCHSSSLPPSPSQFLKRPGYIFSLLSGDPSNHSTTALLHRHLNPHCACFNSITWIVSLNHHLCSRMVYDSVFPDVSWGDFLPRLLCKGPSGVGRSIQNLTKRHLVPKLEFEPGTSSTLLTTYRLNFRFIPKVPWHLKYFEYDF